MIDKDQADEYLGDEVTVLDRNEDGSVEWIENRRSGIGGSDAATVIGLQPYGKTRVDLWKEKLNRKQPFTGNVATAYGSEIESYIFDAIVDNCYEYEWDEDLAEIVECEWSFCNAELDWMRGNVDGLIPNTALLEIKTSSQPPPEVGAKDIHYAQIQHYLAVTGFEYAYYVYFEVPFKRKYALAIERQFVDCEDDYWRHVVDWGDITVRKINANLQYQQKLVEAEEDFWQCVESEEIPGKYLPEGEIEVEDEQLAELIDEYGKAKAKINARNQRIDLDEPKQRKKEAKEAIKQRAQAYDAKRIHLANGKPGDQVMWNGRGYWQAKPADRSVGDESELDSVFE